MSSVTDVVALSPGQAGMVAVSLAEPTYDPYLVTLALNLTGISASKILDLQCALEKLCQRHPHLTGQIRTARLPHPVLLIKVGIRPLWESYDLRDEPDPLAAAQRVRETEGYRPLPLSTGPLIKATLLQVGGDDTDGHFILLLTMHHVVVDGWCLPQLVGELVALVSGTEERLASAIPFRNHASWLAAQDRGAAEDAWREELLGVEDMPRVGRGVEAVEAPLVAEHRLGAEATGVLRDFAQRNGLTIATLAQLAWARVLSSAIGRDDVVFGQTSSGRHPDVLGGDRLIGGLVTTTPVRVCVDERSPAEAGSELQTRLAGLRRHDWLGSGGVSRAVGMGGREIFDTLLVVENTPAGDVHRSIDLGDGATARMLRIDSPSHYPVTVVVVDDGGLIVRAECLDTLHPDGWAFADPQRTARRVASALTDLATAPALVDVDILLDDESEALRGAAPVDELPPTLDRAFETAVNRTPEALALVDAVGALSFEQCHTQVLALADALTQAGLAAGDPVAVALPRDRRAVIAPFAIAAAGGITVHMDPNQPASRMAQIIADAGATMALTEQDTTAALGPLVEGGVCCGTPEVSSPGAVTWQRFGSPSAGRLAPLRATRRVAYVVFTSGSTGRAKGVAVSHEALLSYWRHHNRHILRPTEKILGRPVRVAHAWSTGFDAAWQPQVALLSGQCVHIIDEETRNDPALLAHTLAEQSIDMIDATPSMMMRLLSAGLDTTGPHGLSVLALGGEAIPQDMWDQLRSLGIAVWNCYGPTEATVECFMARVDEYEHPTIGHPLDAMEAAVIDHRLRPLPPGMSGQLVVWGTQLAEGYLGRPEETAAAFRSVVNGRRCYLTGDQVRLTSAGTVVFEGRIDEQVKINGYRVEPEEAAIVLRNLPGVGDACVVVEENGGRPCLGALVVTDRPADEVRNDAAGRLPAYLLPRTVITVQRIPVTRNGKLDRKAISQVLALANRDESAEGLQEASPALKDLLEAVSVLIGHTPSPRSRFDDLGIDSIGLMDVVSALRNPARGKRAWDVRVRDLVESLNLADAARSLRPVYFDDSPELAAAVSGAWPLPRLAQAYVATSGSDLATIAQSQMISLPVADEAELRRTVSDLLGRLVEAHPILKARLDASGTLLLGDGAAPVLDVIQEGCSLADARAEQVARLNPWEGPLCVAGIRPCAKEASPLLLLTVHHLAVDAVSWRILGQDIKRFGEGHDIEPETTPSPNNRAAMDRGLPDRIPRGPGLVGRHINLQTDVGQSPVSSRRASPEITASLLAVTREGVGVDGVLGITTAATDRDFVEAKGYPVTTKEAWFTVETHGRDGMEDTRAVGWFTAERSWRVELPDVVSRDDLPRIMSRGREDDTVLAASCVNYLGRIDLYAPLMGGLWQFVRPDQLHDELGTLGVGMLPPRFSMTITVHVETTAEGPALVANFTGVPGLLDEEDVEQYAMAWLSNLTEITHETKEKD